ncbi:glycosyltransferase [Desulfovibrio sp. ZJ200]|uniref:glycosyltransferase n=1 Tax=Desulfovibrio sp. ZJ200 TaxID=2709792 RepID=UPI0013EA7E8B|nr:glycosyltransferase [Desulfovibrio sp. ZJ200]
MRVLLISLQDEKEARQSPTRQRAQALEQEQTLALAKAMRDGGRLAPLLVCRKNSRLRERADALHLPVLAVGGASACNPLTLLRLWRWQRRHKKLLVQTVGPEAVPLGRRLRRMRPSGSTLLSHAFFLRPPAPEHCAELRDAQHILCGSGHVRRRILKAWDTARQDAPAQKPDATALQEQEEHLIILPPGISLEGFTPSPEWGEGHFIFGMGESLAPRSGVLQVIRAMAALWQRDDLPPWEVRMLGGGPRFNEALKEAVTLGVESRLCLLHEQYAPVVLRSCHVWIAPGDSPEESPETLWTGFAAGLPVIASQSELHAERLRGQEDAVLPVDESDPQSLAKAMIALMQEADLRRALAARAVALRAAVSLESMAHAACALFEGWFREQGWLEALPPDAAGTDTTQPPAAHAGPEPARPETEQPPSAPSGQV